MYIDARGVTSKYSIAFYNWTAHVLDLHTSIRIAKDPVLLDTTQCAIVGKYAALEVLVNFIVHDLRIAAIFDLNSLKFIFVELVLKDPSTPTRQDEDTTSVPFVDPIDLDGRVAILFYLDPSKSVGMNLVVLYARV
eukprot:CAMPEP_0169408364 /NCGR_PEP_ID=MMETSP1017-20121227/58655_1 /TAXON_ID=342587 /ORGANISM="Karlodinium micrum, Strain CCMP2283" /LENGTH=135 /DNA_ID=CAMNT_0009515451 /DNA_START=199 /DNA_END=606 /DNA_ORIENTATION=-